MQKSGDALIGYTGFVGGNILAQRPFDFVYNSKNIGDIQNKNFNLVVCAGAPGTKWIANKDPEQDLVSVKKLMDNLKTIRCGKLVLISTIDVYPQPLKGYDEDYVIDEKKLTAYGRHRLQLEKFVQSTFDSLIIRLPGIFGTGLRKNVIYDLANGMTDNINPKSLMQFYWLSHIWPDISKALENKLKALNFATEPIALREIATKAFNIDLAEKTLLPEANYDMQTKHAVLWGLQKPYLYSQYEVLRDLKTFINLG